MKLFIYTDGAARGNPGPSASGYLILDKDKKTVAKFSFYNGERTNNSAEYLAIIAALKKAHGEYGNGAEIELYSDSELVVNQLNMNYKVRERKLKVLYEEASGLAKKFAACVFINVPRENVQISAVDRELNKLLDSIKKDENDIAMIRKAGRQEGLF
ncbi:MAG: ribonuclease HI family protein [Candidatus Micrarchaeota archaeon]|nr:ribonuclease HI family protein [Candidatus Micrarchaeota archaeon]